MYKRPQLGESEEDLLKLQNDFFKNKDKSIFQPAAKLVGPKKDGVKFDKASDKEDSTINPDNILANTFEAIPIGMKIGDIKPVDVHKKIAIDSITFANSSSGFPQARRRELPSTSKSCSIFSQQVKKLKRSPENDQMECEDTYSAAISLRNTSEKNVPSRSYIITGNDSINVHKENTDLMSHMTEAEILAEREKLMSTLDPAIIAFLKSKRYHHEQVVDKKEEVIKAQNTEASIENNPSTKAILEDPHVDSWLHFNLIESNKLGWMANVDVNDVTHKLEYEARFDFDGFLLPFAFDDIDEKNRVLYHHGLEPERPGYTLQELFQLCRSTIIQQKTTALHTISNLLRLYFTGLYPSSLLTLPIEQIFFVLRFAMDDNVPSVCLASTAAMRSLFYKELDEQCLDNMLSFGFQVQPMLGVKDENWEGKEDEDDGRMNDQEMVEVDVVRVAVRSGLVARIRYILSNCESSDTFINCLKLLIRFARDSKFVVNKIINEHNLLEVLLQKLQPSSNDDISVNIYILKFLRVFCSRNKEITVKVLKRLNIFTVLIYYLTHDSITSNSKGINIQTECFNLWNVFLHYKLGYENISSIFGSLHRNLKYHNENTNADISTSYVLQSHVSAIYNFISNLHVNGYDITTLLPLINMGIKKWLNQTSNLVEFKCGKLQIISSIFNALAILIKSGFISNNLSEDMVIDFIGSVGFNQITKEISTGSNILNNFETSKSSANLLTVEAAVWNNSEHAIPILQTNSCLPFLNAFSNYMAYLQSTKIILKFLQHQNIKLYLQLLISSPNFYLTSNWFTKIESNMILNILQMSILVQKQIDTSLFYELTVKSLTIYNNEQKKDVEYILKNIVFSPNFYPTDALLENLQLGDDNSLFASCLSLNEDIFSVYSQVLGLHILTDSSDTLCESLRTGNILPVDWIYTPILILYSEQQNYKVTLSEEKQVYIVQNCLKWVYIYEKYFPKLADLINPTDRYCRLACVYLGSDDLFLIPEIRDLLRKCLELLIERKITDLNFSGKIEGLSNFQDFYTQLLEQYQGVSYGDELFGIFLLIPLAQNQNIKLRKTLWSEYAGVVQIFNIPEDKIICPANIFLDPKETDLSLLKCYRRAVVSKNIRVNSFLHTIAKHHLELYCANVRANK